MARVLLGVRGMTSPEASAKVKEVLSNLDGVAKVEAGVEQAAVEYDDNEATVMDFIRALRQVGFAAGME